jgi:hypothetical protein
MFRTVSSTAVMYMFSTVSSTAVMYMFSTDSSTAVLYMFSTVSSTAVLYMLSTVSRTAVLCMFNIRLHCNATFNEIYDMEFFNVISKQIFAMLITLQRSLVNILKVKVLNQFPVGLLKNFKNK